VALVVSGGHTQLWKIELRKTVTIYGNSFKNASNEGVEMFQLTLLGQTRDDAAGEAFDKIARLLGLPYPGGAALAKLAEKGDDCEFPFPRPMIDSGDLGFSFSGLKTAVFYPVRNRKLSDHERANIAACAQEAIVDVLVAKTMEAAAREGAREVILTGGVAANERLRTRLREALGDLPFHVPSPEYCTDNAAMIGAAAVLGLQIPK
jgi:N6-L-threonylcarbamoyladenine synthase